MLIRGDRLALTREVFALPLRNRCLARSDPTEPYQGDYMIFVSEAQVRERITPHLAFEAVAQALIAAADGTGFVNPVVIGRGLTEGEIFSIKSGAATSGRIVGLKVGSYWPGNEAKGLARHGSAVFLLDADTGRITTVVEASELNGPRTAAADAVAASHLARTNSVTLSILGAGHQAGYEAQALCAIRPIQRVLISSRSEQRGVALMAKLEEQLSVNVETTSVEVACREADILVTVTASRTPLFESAWIKPGTHIAAMGSDQVGKQELPIDLLHRGRLFCDLPSQSITIGEFQHIRTAVDSGAITLTAIGDVLSGRTSGRQSADEVTVFDSSGLALQDLFVCARIATSGGDPRRQA